MTKPCLVLYASQHGHVRKIALRIAQRLREAGLGVVVADLADGSAIDVEDYGLVVAGGAIHAGRHPRALRRWLADRAPALNARPTAVFSVSLAAADPAPATKAATEAQLDGLLAEAGVVPVCRACFGGALQYREYGWPTRWLMRRIARKQGLPTDVSQDVDFTDWDAVDRFAARTGSVAPAGALVR
ncbi:flavodoxin domain-containing protein [Patulibacter defluvii]|uniref:flavodoxin domain-containing protein n=1 Tax=Patulibacter defluvii TaxID=3095358 RepID=UPI002A75AA7C|nr:flavodoxin domain-containing protein [Patulibacter sp. DM4]